LFAWAKARSVQQNRPRFCFVGTHASGVLFKKRLMSTQQHARGVRTGPVATAPGSDPDTLAIPFFYFPILDLLI